ncbi:MAG TPA: YbfB/YjiJ family MFS transporter, partial [Candidatus Hydrogenedentes bacterium]|nr:YbfB/YjiJ family MFS transporter [Candidatus Hydrogenedentota bacterium]
GFWPHGSRKRRGLAMGAAVMGTSVGIIITGALIPFILKTRGDEAWREGWFVLGICALGAGAAAWFLLRNRPGDVGQDPIGMEKGGSAEVQVAKGEDSLHWGRVYRSGVVWHLAMIYSMFGFSYIIYATFFKKYIVTEAGFGETDAGLVWQMVGWLGISCGLTWGWVSDRIGRKWGLAMVYLIQATAFLLFAMGKTAGPIWVSAILFGLTAWSIPAIMAAACGDQLGPRMAPAAIGFVTLFFGIGQAVAPSVAGRIADQTGSFSTAYLCAAAAALLGGTGSLFLRKSH